MKKGLSNKEIDALKLTNLSIKKIHELDFREWINSCLIYGHYWRLTPEDLIAFNRSIDMSTLDLYNVKLERALEIIEEQKERFKDATVECGTFTDSEGCTYNTCTWKEK